MKLLFLLLCSVGTLYSVLYGIYCISEGKRENGVSALVLALLAALSMAVLMAVE